MERGKSVIICKTHNRLRMTSGWVFVHRPLNRSFLLKFTRTNGAGRNAAVRLIIARCDKCRRTLAE